MSVREAIEGASSGISVLFLSGEPVEGALLSAYISEYHSHLSQGLSGALDEDPSGLEAVRSSLPTVVGVLLENEIPQAAWESVQELLKTATTFALSIRKDHCNLALELLSIILDVKRPFYRTAGFPEGDTYAGSGADEATPQWRAQLGFASWVDAVRVHHTFRDWDRAQIVNETPTHFTVQFEGYPESYNRTVPRDSPEIAPEYSKSKRAELSDAWFNNLKVGDHFDARDHHLVWYNAECLEIIQDMIGRKARVGFRIYLRHGDFTDEHGCFRGWESKFDEIIPLDFYGKQRFAPFNTRAEHHAVVMDFPVHDEDDPSYNPENPDFSAFAVYRRPARWGSPYFVEVS